MRRVAVWLPHKFQKRIQELWSYKDKAMLERSRDGAELELNAIQQIVVKTEPFCKV